MSSGGADRAEALFREHRERLARFARHLLGAGADADDLVQETFLKALDHLRSGREIRSPVSFLFVTMRNLVNDAHRRQHGATVDTAVDVEESDRVGGMASLERQVMSEREFEALCEAIAQLPERMRYAFVLRKVYGYSCREIAERLGRSPNTVREQVAQSFKRLQTLQRDAGAARDRSGPRTRTDERNAAEVRLVNIAPLASRESS